MLFLRWSVPQSWPIASVHTGMICSSALVPMLSQVRRMIVGATESWLRDYRMDGLRFDSVKDVPMDMVQVRGGHAEGLVSQRCSVGGLCFLPRTGAAGAGCCCCCCRSSCGRCPALSPAACPSRPPFPLAALQEATWTLRQRYPGRILTAEITPEDPQLMVQYGFDAIWVHSGGWSIFLKYWKGVSVDVLGQLLSSVAEVTTG